MFGYIASQPKGTFTNDQLQTFVAMEWITQDEYNQLVVTEPASQPEQSASANTQQSASAQPTNIQQ